MMRVLRCLAVLVLLMAGYGAGLTTALVSTASPATAQSQAPDNLPDYEAWTRVATRADEAIETGRASTNALEALRRELADWRQRFLEAQTSIATRLRPHSGNWKRSVRRRQRARQNATRSRRSAPFWKTGLHVCESRYAKLNCHLPGPTG